MELTPIRGLAEAVAAALSVDYDGPDNGQVRRVPDTRSIRYYTTLGMLDRPAAMDGRTALYGERHLLQLVAIKRLQAEGLSLSEIQARLTGLSARGLAELARLPAPIETKSRTKPRATAFWKEEPGPAPPRAIERERAPEDRRASLTAFEVGPLALLFRRVREIDDADAALLLEAAAPLLRVLETRGLIAPLEAERNEEE